MSDLTVRELKRDASRVKREIDTLEKAAYGMTFEELLRLLAGGQPESMERETEGVSDNHLAQKKPPEGGKKAFKRPHDTLFRAGEWTSVCPLRPR